MANHIRLLPMSSGELDAVTGKVLIRETTAEQPLPESALNSKKVCADKCHKCHAAPESPDIVCQKLRELDEQIDRIPAHKKQALILAQERCPDLLTTEFRLRFLRTEILDVPRAAKRYAHYWELRVRLFQDKAFEPLTLAEEDEVRALRSGVVQTIPGHDRVLRIDTGRLDPECSIDSLAKTQWYVFTRALDCSADIQRYGGIFVIDLQHSFTHLDLLKQISERANDGFPLRCAAACLLNPPRFVGPLLRVAKWFLRPRVRDKIHVIASPEQFLEHVGVTQEALLEGSALHEQHLEWVDRNLTMDRECNW